MTSILNQTVALKFLVGARINESSLEFLAGIKSGRIPKSEERRDDL